LTASTLRSSCEQSFTHLRRPRKISAVANSPPQNFSLPRHNTSGFASD
jgi:hypothetical protein